jgi:hypothetical protein
MISASRQELESEIKHKESRLSHAQKQRRKFDKVYVSPFTAQQQAYPRGMMLADVLS